MKEATKYVSQTYIDQAVEARKSLSKSFRMLISQVDKIHAAVFIFYTFTVNVKVLKITYLYVG